MSTPMVTAEMRGKYVAYWKGDISSNLAVCIAQTQSRFLFYISSSLKSHCDYILVTVTD